MQSELSGHLGGVAAGQRETPEEQTGTLPEAGTGGSGGLAAGGPPQPGDLERAPRGTPATLAHSASGEGGGMPGAGESGGVGRENVGAGTRAQAPGEEAQAGMAPTDEEAPRPPAVLVDVSGPNPDVEAMREELVYLRYLATLRAVTMRGIGGMPRGGSPEPISTPAVRRELRLTPRSPSRRRGPRSRSGTGSSRRSDSREARRERKRRHRHRRDRSRRRRSDSRTASRTRSRPRRSCDRKEDRAGRSHHRRSRTRPLSISSCSSGTKRSAKHRGGDDDTPPERGPAKQPGDLEQKTEPEPANQDGPADSEL